MTPATNKGKGRLTSMVHEGGTITRQYDVRGNVTSDARVITASGTTARTVSYLYNAADLVTQINYPSGRQVAYTRDTMGRITTVQSRKISTDPWTNIATGIVYQPMSRLVQSLTAGNGLSNWSTYTADYELDLNGVYDGATKLIERTHTRTDSLNLTNIFDNVTAANNQSYWHSPSNRLQNADGPWGSRTYFYDGVGNRTYENATISGVTTSDNFTYPATSNRVQSVVRLGTTTRALTYDNAGNILTDSRSGGPYTYTYNNANRLKTVSASATVRGSYTYNGFEQLIYRSVQNSGTANGSTGFVHDLWGNVIAETLGTGIRREYIYLPETEIAPTREARAQVDRPIAVVDEVQATNWTMLMVHVDHLNRPVRMTNSTKASVWDVVYTPWGAFHSATGAQTLNARFPGQWFQLESALHYNWHRHYDPSLGRYTQPDPLGFVDGPSVYAYARSGPQRYVDKDGRFVPFLVPAIPELVTAAATLGVWLTLPKPPDLTPKPPIPQEPEQCHVNDDDEDCKQRMTKHQIRQCRIDPHELKYDILGRRAQIAKFELCKCSNGEVAVRNKGCTGPTERTGVMCP